MVVTRGLLASVCGDDLAFRARVIVASESNVGGIFPSDPPTISH